MHKAFWLGLIGGILGIIISILLLLAGYAAGTGVVDYYAELGDPEEISELLYQMGSVGLACSIVGTISGTMERQKAVGGVLMIVSGVIMLLFTTIFGVITFIMFLIGGVLMLSDHSKEKKAGPVPLFQPQPYPGQPVPYPYPGQAAPTSGPAPILFCPRCGAPRGETGQRYCEACGKKLE